MTTERLMRNTRPALPEEFPLLCKVHRQLQIDFMKEESIQLRVGKLSAVGTTNAKDESGKWTVFVDEGLAKSLKKKQLAFLLGHELYHVADLKVGESKERKAVEASFESRLLFVKHPVSLIIEKVRIQSDAGADIGGIFACRDADVILSVFRRIHGDEPVREIEEGKFKGEYKAGDFNYFCKLRLAIMFSFVINLLQDFSEVLHNPAARKEYIGKSKFESEFESLLAPLMEYSHQDDLALTSYLGAALFVLSKWKRSSGELGIFSDIMERFADFDPQGSFTQFDSEEIALKRMIESRSKAASIKHPFKDRAMSMLAEAAWHSRERKKKRAGFIYDEGYSLGYDEKQISCIIAHHRN